MIELHDQLTEAEKVAAILVDEIDQAISIAFSTQPPEGWSVRDKALRRRLNELRTQTRDVLNGIAELV